MKYFKRDNVVKPIANDDKKALDKLAAAGSGWEDITEKYTAALAAKEKAAAAQQKKAAAKGD